MENYNSGYKFYRGCDIYMHKNCVSERGYPSTYTLIDMIHLAKINDCHIIVKNGNGKWYLKCQGQDNDEATIIRKINESIERNNHPRVLLWHIF